MIRPKQWTRRGKDRTYIVRDHTDAVARDARAKVLGAHRAYRVASDHLYLVSDMPSIGESLDVLVADLDHAADWSQEPRKIVRHTLAAIALLTLFVLPLGLAELVATAYVGWLSARTEVEVVDMPAEVDPKTGLTRDEAELVRRGHLARIRTVFREQRPGEWN